MNETPFKVLCYNICLVVQAIVEFGIEPSLMPRSLDVDYSAA